MTQLSDQLSQSQELSRTIFYWFGLVVRYQSKTFCPPNDSLNHANHIFSESTFDPLTILLHDTNTTAQFLKGLTCDISLKAGGSRI